MENLIVKPKDATEYESLRKFLEEKGIGFITEEDQEQLRKREARRKFVETIQAIPKSDISFDEITEIVEQVRSERYATKNQGHS